MRDRVMIVTGGFGTLGRAVAAAAQARGAAVIRIDRAPAREAEPPGMLDIGGVDIADPAAAADAVRTAVARFGALDVLVNVAGGFVWQSFQDGGPPTWARMYEINLATTLGMTGAALPHLLPRTGARIINVAAAAAMRATAGMGAYAAAKSGVIRLTESLAEELRGHDITVNAVLPGIIDTKANRADMPDADRRDWVAPAAIAEVILFLASPEAAAISGAAIPVTRAGPALED